jgi:hypothetical protein
VERQANFIAMPNHRRFRTNRDMPDFACDPTANPARVVLQREHQGQRLGDSYRSALHSSIGLAERRGLLTYLTYKGVFIDVGRLADALADGLQREVLNAYPKPTDGSHIADAIIAHAKRSPSAALPGSLAAYLLLQQREREHQPT